MKRAEYCINVLSVAEYPKVNGWIEEVTDSRGNTLTIGYDKRGKNCWISTELITGFSCNTKQCRTKTECIEDVHNNIDLIVDVCNKRKNDSQYYIRYIQPFIYR